MMGMRDRAEKYFWDEMFAADYDWEFMESDADYFMIGRTLSYPWRIVMVVSRLEVRTVLRYDGKKFRECVERAACLKADVCSVMDSHVGMMERATADELEHERSKRLADEARSSKPSKPPLRLLRR